MGPPSMKNLLRYLENSFMEPTGTNPYSLDICLYIPWNRRTTAFVLSYIFQFISKLEHCEFDDEIRDLDEIAKCVSDALAGIEVNGDYTSEIYTQQVEFQQMLTNSFFLEVVRRFFVVPQLHQLPQSDRHLYPNEILAGFLDFLLQVLFHETNISEDHMQWWSLMRTELSFLLAVLGDIPFQCTHHEHVEQVNSLLAEFEMLANDAGSFVYACVFPTDGSMEAYSFDEIKFIWFQKVDLLNVKIKEHCLKFSELPMSVISRSSVVDSFFIVHSLIEDIENLKNHRLNFSNDDAVIELMETLHGVLIQSQNFVNDMGDSESNEEKEGLIQIRDLTYEAEYLINSLAVGNVDFWYLNLRLPSIIHKFKLALIGLQQISDSTLMRASDGKLSFPICGSTATTDDNHFLDFNEDITKSILKDQSDYMQKLEFSYRQLPGNLKPCFLYFAAFPKDSEISQEELTGLWIAEGFIQNEGNRSPEETAETYLLDLINRKLVLSAKKGSQGLTKMCRIHGLLHEFCVRKANEENFLKLTNDFSVHEKCRRLCVPSTSIFCLRPFGLHCRSYRDLRTQQYSTSFQTMALLKVMDHSPENYSSSPSPGLAFPAQLRYLCVGNLSNEMVENLANLEFICVRSKKKVSVPSVVLRMVKLRHLVVTSIAEFEEDCCSDMAGTTNLRTLSTVSINGKKDEDILRCWCPHLHKLKCIFTDDTKFPDLSFLDELELLKLFFPNGLSADMLSSKITLPLTIKKLSLGNSYLPWAIMSILGRLPNLNVLKLDCDAFRGHKWETRDGEFQKLKCLKIYNCRSLRLLLSCSGHFPVLECLVLRKCLSLRKIPSDFGNIPTLHRIEVKCCTEEVCLLALRMGKHIQVDIDRSEDDLILLECKIRNNQAVQKKAMGPPPSMENVLGCLENSPMFGVGKDTRRFVVSYIFQFISGLENCELTDAIITLDKVAKCLYDALKRSGFTFDLETMHDEFSEMLVEVVLRFFMVPKPHQLPRSDKHLYSNEIIAAFLDFLLQVLYHQANTSSGELQRWAVMRKELSFLLAVLGDIPFQCTQGELDKQVIVLLREFEMLANDSGSLVYDSVFSIDKLEDSMFNARKITWFKKVELLNDKIKEHCLINFSELPISKIPRSSVVDLVCIIQRLIEDLQSIIMNAQLGSFTPDDAMKEQLKTLQGELILSQSIINVMQENDTNIEEKDSLIQIRDLTYEAEYLIGSLVVGNIHVWYSSLRLPSIIHKIKLARLGLQQIADSKLMKDSDGKLSFPITGNMPAMDDNHFLDFNDDIRQRILKDQRDYMKILELSYKHLPCNLKPCFLYFAAFPKDSEILLEELTWLWIAEGFILKKGNKSLEEIAETYLLDLINRKLVLIAKRGSNGVIKKCRIQSVLHEFCVWKANEENFLKLTNDFSVYEKCQLLCVPSTSKISLRPFGLHCRSYRDLRTHQYSTCFQTMALLKVVDHSPKNYSSSPSPVPAFPAQLRYLGVGHLSNDIMANLMNLEFIYVSTDKKIDLPSVVLRMVKLRHLVVTEGGAEFEEDWCSNITETTNLRTLSGVYIDGEKHEDILRWCQHLCKLKCSFGDRTIFPDLSFLAELESLKMWFQFGLSAKILSSKINIPSTIKKLCLGGSRLPWEMMSIFGRLPNLQVLKLDKDAFTGVVWVTRDGEFQNLKCLKVYGCYLLLWISCSEHFPTLECLVLRDCEHLLEVPSDFANIPTLQRIEMVNCNKEACFPAVQIGKKIQVDIRDNQWTEGSLILEHTYPKPDEFMDLLSYMQEYFKAGGSEAFVKKLPVTDHPTEHETTDEDSDTFVLRDVLSYMEEYFKDGGSEESMKKLAIIDQIEDETRSYDGGDHEPLIFRDHQSYSIVVSYAMQFCSNLKNSALSDAILGLRRISESYKNRKQFLPGYPCYVDEIEKNRREFSDMLTNSFIPQIQRFFKVAKVEELPDKDKHLNKNEILAGFLNFLTKMFFCEVNNDLAEVEQYPLLQKELSFLLAVLGDIPFQPTDHPEFEDQLNNLLAEFEMFVNEAGGFLFSCVFPIQPMKVSTFRAETNGLLKKAKHLNAKIKEHCSNFSELPESVVVRSNIVDSFFIIDSLVEDLQSFIMNGLVGGFTPDDAMKEQMKTLHNELTESQSFFTKVMQDKDSNKKKGLIQIRDLTYEAEYLINSLLSGNIHLWYINLRLPSIVCKIKLVHVGLEQMSKAEVTKSSDGRVSFPATGNTAAIDDSKFLDFNCDFMQRILDDLTGSDESRRVLKIFGMPGLGKTTTANKLYNGNVALNHFDRRAWCVVSEKYSVRALFIQLLIDLENEAEKNSEWKVDDAELGVKIYKSLKGRRYLIVLDDIWHTGVLDKLTRYFPDDRKGSRVIITTRNKDVSPDGSSIPYELPILSEHQCWNLLEKKVFPNGPCPSNLVSIGKKIAKRCSGVPLAVVSIGGILLNVEKERSEWEIVEEGLDKFLLDDESDYRKIMELSYQHLPCNLKPCFLSFAGFPEDAEIPTKELTWYWIAQGLIKNDGKMSPEEIAETYLSDLINRSLVMTAQRRSVGGAKTCRVHDLLHDICIKKADEEDFLNSANLSSTYEKHQHLSLLSSPNIYWRPFGHHCRSFRGYSDQWSNFQTMALLKGVDLLHLNYGDLFDPPRVYLPCQLRYLGIDSKQIPEGMLDNLVDLEVLHIRGYKVALPSVILRMAKLRHLFVRKEAVFEEDCSNNIPETTNLRSISRVVISKKSDVEILRKSPHLQTLKCSIEGGITFPDLTSLAELVSLRMDFHIDISAVKIKFPSTLTKLCLYYGRLPWEKMSIIGKLPNLQVLKLKKNAFMGKKWKTKDDQFQELRFLKMEYVYPEKWSTESSHFPSLERLELHRCGNLKIPSDLGYIPMLQGIEVRNCEKEACLSAIEIEKEQRECGNQQLQVHISNPKWTKEELIKEGEEAMQDDTETESENTESEDTESENTEPEDTESENTESEDTESENIESESD